MDLSKGDGAVGDGRGKSGAAQRDRRDGAAGHRGSPASQNKTGSTSAGLAWAPHKRTGGSPSLLTAPAREMLRQTRRSSPGLCQLCHLPWSCCRTWPRTKSRGFLATCRPLCPPWPARGAPSRSHASPLKAFCDRAGRRQLRLPQMRWLCPAGRLRRRQQPRPPRRAPDGDPQS